MKKQIFGLALAFGLMSCSNANSNSTKAMSTNSSEQDPIPEKTEAAKKTGKTSFVINGVSADNMKGTDTEPGVNFNNQNENMSLYIFGDRPNEARAGMLNISLMPFELKTGTFDCKASFTRYTQENGGGENINYNTKSFSLTFTKMEATNDEKVWIVSGNFSGELKLAPYQKQTGELSLKITDGKFEDLKLTRLGKMK